MKVKLHNYSHYFATGLVNESVCVCNNLIIKNHLLNGMKKILFVCFLVLESAHMFIFLILCYIIFDQLIERRNQRTVGEPVVFLSPAGPLLVIAA